MSRRRTQLDRRRFLKASGVAGLTLGAAVAVPSNPVWEALRNVFGRPRLTAADLDAQVLARMTGETVNVAVNGKHVPLVVDEITAGSQILSDKGTSVGTVFSVMLSGAAAAPLVQGTYDVESDRVGTFPLFVVPNDVTGVDTQRYEAVFSRLT